MFSRIILLTFYLLKSESFLGVNYGQVADNLPSSEATVKLLQYSAIEKVRLYGSEPVVIKAFTGTGIDLMIGASNSDIPGMASDLAFVKNWIDANVIPFYPTSKIIIINVGNETMSYNDRNLTSQLMPVMQSLQNALDSAGLAGKNKVSTVHSMVVLRQFKPPSSGSFDPSIDNLFNGLLNFNTATGSPFAINPYPYFTYRSDPRLFLTYILVGRVGWGSV
ncbi:Glycosyl hydrolase family 17 protein [Perilla frutescens var. hirtella]|nr:Glycosyl hydrolase family 17 protein [Perilla frutescens var. hirtella]